MLLHVADLLGVAVFSVSGALAAGRARLDLLGVAAIAAIGGGTVRDLLLNRHPSGAQVAEAAGLPSLIVVLMGTVSGVAGGVIRDVLTGQIPLILRADICATAAIAGIAVYLFLEASTIGLQWAFGVGFAVVIALRLLAILRGIGLPVFHLPG
jgi:uncharacterized membrane protein YeiH